MKIYEGLEAHQAIKCNDKYVVQLGLGYGNAYEIAGAVCRGNQQVVVDDLSEIKRYIPEQKKTVGAIIADGSEVPIAEIQQFHSKYDTYRDEDTDDLYFGEDTEAELQYVKDKAYYRVQEYVYETTPAYTEDLQITVVGSVEDTGSDFIETPYVYGKANFGSSGVYRVNLSSIAMDEFCKVRNEYDQVSFDLPTHSHLEYAKVDNKYVFTKNHAPWIKKGGNSIILNDLEQAHEKEREVRKFVRGVAETYAAPKKAGDVEIKDFVEHLRSLKIRTSDLQVKQKSYHGRIGLLRTLDELIQKYTQEVS